MRILIIGVRSHIFIRSFVRWLRRSKLQIDNVDILSIAEKSSNKSEDELFDNIYSVSTTVLNKLPLLEKIADVFYHANFRKLLQRISPSYDLIHVHYIENIVLRNASFFKRVKQPKIVVSIWGSDYYRRGEKSKIKMLKLLNRADITTFTNKVTQKDLIQFYFNTGKRSDIKTEVLRFGLEPLEILKNLNKTPAESKQFLELPTDAYVVCVGYNANPAQQHIEIIKGLIKKEKELPENLIIILPLTYGSKQTYVGKIKNELKKGRFKSKLFLSYMTELEVAHLRNACDVMIQLQITDQFSGSMQEHLYCGNIVITGSWLPYKTMDEQGVYFRKIDHVSKIGDELADCFKDYQNERSKYEYNKDVIYSLSSWKSNINRWTNLYNRLVVYEH